VQVLPWHLAQANITILRMKNIVIIGGGFGGTYTAKYLLDYFKNDSRVKITLISKDNFFTFTPMLHEVATGGLNRHNVVIPIRSVLKGNNFEFQKCEVDLIDFSKRKIITKKFDMNYDILIITTGSTTNFHNIPGAEKYCLTLKSLKDAALIRDKIIDALELASKANNLEERKKLMTFAVIGAGPTGVELSAEMAEYICQMLHDNYKNLGKSAFIYLVQKGPKIIPMAHEKCIEEAKKELERKGIKILLNSEVTKVSEDNFEINNKQKIMSSTIIFTSGIKPVPIKSNPKITLPSGHYSVDQFLQVKNLKNVYALGDCTLFFNPNSKKPLPALAQVTTKEAKAVAKNIYRLINGKQQKLVKINLSGFLVSVGQKFAVAEIGPFKFKGFFAWWLWRTIYLFKMLGTANKFRIAFEWTINLFAKRDTSQI